MPTAVLVCVVFDPVGFCISRCISTASAVELLYSASVLWVNPNQLTGFRGALLLSTLTCPCLLFCPYILESVMLLCSRLSLAQDATVDFNRIQTPCSGMIVLNIGAQAQKMLVAICKMSRNALVSFSSTRSSWLVFQTA